MRPTALLACVLFAASAPLAHAASDATKATAQAPARQKAAGMTAEEKAAAKAKRESMTPEEKAEARKRRAAKTTEGGATSAEKKEAPARKPGPPLPAPSAGPN